MNEANVRQEVYRLVRRLSYMPHRLKDAMRCPSCKKVVPPFVKGRPDLLVNSAFGPGIYIEVKVLNLEKYKSFAFRHVSPEQIQYLDRMTERGFRCYLALGTVGAARGKRQLWLFDWEEWTALVNYYTGSRKSVPYKDLDVLHKDWEMSWSDGCWHAPREHSIWQDACPEEVEI